MATGDVRGNFERLKVQLRSISYPHALDIQGCNEGLPAAILPLIHYALLGYSRHVARYLSVNGYVLYAKSDLRFVECVVKLLRKEFEYRCPLTIAQIFGRGFAEKKFLFVHDLIQMCKRKHNDLLRVVRNSEKKTPVCRPKAFGTLLHQSQRRPILRNKHLSSKFDRRCELDLLPDIKCREVRQRSSCQDNTWFVPPEGRTRLSGVAEEDEDDIRAQSLQRAKQRGLRVLTRVKDHNIDETCHIPHMHIGTGRSAMMGAKMIHRDRGYGSMYSDPAFQEKDHEHEETSPRSSCDFTRQKHGNTSMSFGDYPVPLEEPVTSKKLESQSQTPTTPENNCPHDHLHKNQLASSKACGCFNIPTLITADDPPQAMWQKIIDLASKIDSCFCSLDNKIAQSFNSLDEKLETKFKYLDEGVASTRETLQEKLSVLENRIENLERTSQISPMSLQSNVTYNDSHPIRDITNTFNSSIDNRSWRNYSGLPLRDPLIYYPKLFQQQDTQSIQNIPMHAGLLRTNTQDFIACVKARFHQTKEMLNVNDTPSF